MNKILIVDDEISICDSLTFILEDSFEVFSSQTPKIALETIKKEGIDVVLLDLKLGEYNGLDLLEEIKELDEDIQIIMMTAYGSIQSSVEAMKRGASHYITKPLDSNELFALIDNAIKVRELSGSLSNLQEIVENRYSKNVIIGESYKFKELMKKVEHIKDLDTTVLVTGESGTGKDLIAKSIHFNGNRREQKLQIVNCAAIPKDLLESELFGYEKGAFTGAEKRKLGKIELAHKGTLFLDEIGDMDYNLQTKILRVVEDMRISPLGSEGSREVDVRIIAATNKDLKAEVDKGNFREDLYYRLNVVNLKVPALRERVEDIPILTKYFIDKYSKKFNKKIQGISKEAEGVLKEYNWPGNIRELENLIERIMVFQMNSIIEKEDIPSEYFTNGSNNKDIIAIEYGQSLSEVEKQVILETLDYNDGNRKKTAEMLNISKRNLQYKLKEYLG